VLIMGFVVVPTELSPSELSESLAMIQHVISTAFSFIGCIELISESNLPLAGPDVCHPRHPIYLIFPLLGVMLRVPTALHLPVTHDDDITRQLANCDENYNFSVHPYSMLQKFAVDSEMIVMSHSEIVRKSHTWRTGSPRVLRRLVLMTDELDISCDPGISFVFNRDDVPLSTIYALTELPSFTADS